MRPPTMGKQFQERGTRRRNMQEPAETTRETVEVTCGPGGTIWTPDLH